jgi:hypothetical protein
MKKFCVGVSKAKRYKLNLLHPGPKGAERTGWGRKFILTKL